MTITLEIPDELASRIIAAGSDPSRQALEDMAVEAYRAHRISEKQLRALLGMESSYELDGFLKERGVWLEYTMEDLLREGELSATARRREEPDTRA